MKVCSTCKKEKPITEYYKSKNAKDNLQGKCKCCQNKINKQRYNDNPDHKKKLTIINNKLIRARNFTFIARYLQRFGKCVDCDHSDIRVLEFDHREQENKIGGVKRLADDYASIKRIKNEIRKCEIRCCNCHRIRTQKQLGWKSAVDWLKF